ncbi:peptidylprolyl isomerase [Devosia sp.]|uniref:peptidylprolyl isomerase n=1 Tax=Devosia sp. TaxID=1871048 RepID=UPI001ACA9F88|nr:peptidylprolyl isomerase [Devosia sp.]MBN9308469.1 SurA N-terminal domain-containing protein [Devosia sp.]
MLEGLRHLTTTWFGKILGVFLLIGLAGFGISNVILQFGSSTVATVAGQDISIKDYQRAYDSQINALAQRFGRVPTLEEAISLGVPGAVIDRLSGEAAVNKFATDMGIGVSEDRLSKMLREDPNFASALGQFDRATFVRALQQSGYTEAEYFDLQTRAARRQQLVSGLLAGVPVSATAVDIINRYAADTRSIDYFVLNAQTLPSVAEPTEDELATYLKDHQADFRTKPTRNVELLALSPDVIASTKTITDEQVAAEYERTKDSRVKIEKRTIEQVALTTPELEKAFADGQAAATPIADVLKATGATPTILGTLSKAEVTDSSLADAAFGLKAANDYTIIEGIGAKRAVIVTAIEAGGQVSLDDSKDAIRKQLALAEARSEYGDILDQIEELRAAFKPLTEIADRFGLKTFTLAMTPGAPELPVQPDLSADDVSKIATTVFNATQGELSPTITLSSNRAMFFDLKSVQDARDQSLDEVRDAVKTAWTNAKTEEAMTAQVAKMLDELKAGKSIADVASEVGQFPTLSQPLKRSGDGTPVLNQAVANEVFNGGPDHFGSAVNGDGDHVVFKVAEVVQAAADATPQAKQYVEDTTRESVYQALLAGLKGDAGLRINQQVMSQLLDTGTVQ